MATEKIFFAVEVDSGQSVSNLEKLRANLEGVKNEIKSIERARKRGTITAKEANKQTAALNVKLAQNRKAYNEANKAAAGFAKTSTSLTKTITKAGLAIAGAFALRAIVSGIGGATDTIVEFDEAMANLQKTTGLSKEAAIELAKELKQFDTRTSTKALLELASAAGRLGLEGSEIIDFTREVDKAFVALGDSLEGNAEEIGLTLGKIAANFDLEERFGIGEAINKVGSSLNELGANSKATESAIIDFTNRLSGVASQAGITVPEVQALGALFDETGQSIEVASTTFNKLLPAMGANVEKFAAIAGKGVEEFRVILEEDAFEALKLVAVGAKSSEKGLIGLTETLKNFGVDSARAASIVGILANKTERLTELQAIANKAFDEGTSLTDEFNIKNETLGANLEKISNSYDNWITSLDSGDGILSITVGLFADFVQFLDKASKSIEEIRAQGEDNAWAEILRNDLGDVTFLTKKLTASGLDEIKARERAIELISEQLEGLKESQNLWGSEVQAIDDRIAALKESNIETKESTETIKEETAKLTDLIEVEKEKLKVARDIIASDEEATARKNDKIASINEEIKRLKALTKVQEDFDFRRLEGIEAKKLALQQETTDSVDEFMATTKLINDEIQRERDKQEAIRTITQDGLNAIDNLTSVFNQNKLNDLSRTSREELEAINNREALMLSNQNLSTDERNRIKDKANADRLASDQKNEEEQLRLEKIAFNRNKAFQLAEIGINLAAELSAISLNAAKNPANAITFGAAGISQAAVLSGIAVALAAVNSTAVAAQKFAKGGIIQGASHANGGVPIMGGTAEVEGNEIILHKGVTANPSLRAAASQLNVLGGGNKFADGGILSNNLPTFALPQQTGNNDLNAIVDAIADIRIQLDVQEVTNAQGRINIAEGQAQI